MESADSLNSVGEVEGTDTAPAPRNASRFRAAVPALISAALLLTAYAGYQRMGTTAGVDRIEFTRNLTGGFLAVGMSDDLPGIVVFSELERAALQVHAEQLSSPAAGDVTTVHVTTPSHRAKWRLRGPLALLITLQGSVECFEVDWTLAEFHAIRRATECGGHGDTRPHRCGAPFAGVSDLLAKWPAHRVPAAVRRFLARYTAR